MADLRPATPPRVSICIPVFNGVRYVEVAIRSALDQTYRDREVVVVDNGSTDGTVAILESFGPSVRLVRQPRHTSLIENFNTALEVARGELVKVLCADDLLYPSCIERQVLAYDQGQPGVVLVTNRGALLTASGRKLVAGRRPPHPGRCTGEQAIGLCVRHGANLIGSSSAVLAARAALVSAGGFSDDLGITVSDLALWCRMLRDADAVFLPDVLSGSRMSPGSESATRRRSARAELRRALDEAARGELVGVTAAARLQGRARMRLRLPIAQLAARAGARL